MKLHTRQLQNVFSSHINFQLHLTKNMIVPVVLKKSCLKIQYRNWLTLNNYITCLMVALNAEHTSKPQTHFLWGNAKDIPLWCVWTLIAWLFLQGNSLKIPLQSKPFLIKPTTPQSFWANPVECQWESMRVTAATLESSTQV